jgi:glycerate 2-kinase
MDASRFFTHSLRDPRVARILAAAIEAVNPGTAVERYLASNPLSSAGRVFALGLGKAALPMTRALSRHADLTRALVITKHVSSLELQAATIMESGHPVPDARSLAAGQAALEFVSSLREEDLLVCLISGGGSALMTAPLVPLEDMQALTSALLACGARIDEINTLRRHLDRVKGGGIAKATKARVLSLILSDVVGSPLEAIASGPTAPDPTTKQDALGVLKKYFSLSLRGAAEQRRGNLPVTINSGLLRSARNDIKLPVSILQSLSSNLETPKPNDSIFSRVQNMIVGDNALAIQAALEQAKLEGFQAESLGSDWQGEAREVGFELARKLRVTIKSRKHLFCLIAGGETTVTLSLSKRDSSVQAPKSNGKGGRNQELALAAVPELAGLENALLVSLATDGEDGPTDAAGAVVNGETLQRAEELDLSVADYLSRNDAYSFFERLGDLLKIGPTGTNVNDLAFLLKI